jgi:hypothetical protein
LGLVLAVVGLSACSLLLDTESLQKKGSATTTTGSGGSAGNGGMGGDDGGDAMAVKDGPAYEAGRPCNSDSDCLPGLDVDGCILYTCGPADDRTCKPPKPNTGGLGVVAAGAIETVLTADEIGYPSIVADGSEFLMGTWHRTGVATDVLLVKYPALPQGSAKVELSALAGATFRSYASSPGIITRSGVPRRMRMLLAAERVGDAGGVGMHLVDLDVPMNSNNVKLSTPQPTPADLGISGYDTRPRSFPPRMFPSQNPLVMPDPSGMWIQQQKLFTFDGTTAKEAFSTKHVLGFSPLAGMGGVHAALETAEIVDGGNGVERTELWSDGSATLISLVGDDPGARRGVSSTSTTESGSNANILAWSFEPRMGLPQYDYAAAFCLGNSCSSVALPNMGMAIPAVFPELASMGVMGSKTDRDIVQAFEVIFADTMQPTMADSVLFAGASRFTIRSADLSNGSTQQMNPPLFIVDVEAGPIGLAAGDVLGPSSVAVTNDGQILVAWVVHPTTTTAVLKARRFSIKTCP